MMLLTAENGRFRSNLKHYKSFDDAAKAYIAGEIAVLAGTRSAIEACIRVTPGLKAVAIHDSAKPCSEPGPPPRSVLVIDADDHPDVVDAARRLRGNITTPPATPEEVGLE